MTAANPPADSAAAVPPADAAPDPRRWLILAVIALAQLMIVLDATVVNIALPSAQRALHFTTVDRQWVVTAYALAFGSLLLLGGRVSSLVGRKVTFLSGLIGFAAASAVGGAATSFGMLVAARACQGAFGAFMAPSALSLLTTTFSGSKDRGRAFGVFGAIAGAGGAIGLLLGGVLTEYLSWRWCLYVNLFFAAIAVTGGAILLGRHPRSGHHRLDIPGAAFVSSGMFCIVYGFSNAATHSWHTPSTWGFLIAGVLLLAIFAWWESRTREPLLPLRVVLDRNRGGAYLSILIAGSGMFGIFLFITYYLQQTLGFSPVTTGLAFLPMIALVMISSNVSNIVLMPRFGPRPLVTTGMLLAAVGLAWLTRIGAHSSYATAIAAPAGQRVRAGHGDRAVDQHRDVRCRPGGRRGRLGQRQHRAAAWRLDRHLAAQHGGRQRDRGLPDRASQCAHPVRRQAERLAGQVAQVHGYTTAFWWACAIFCFGAVVAAVLFRRGPLATQGRRAGRTPSAPGRRAFP